MHKPPRTTRPTRFHHRTVTDLDGRGDGFGGTDAVERYGAGVAWFWVGSGGGDGDEFGDGRGGGWGDGLEGAKGDGHPQPTEAAVYLDPEDQ